MAREVDHIVSKAAWLRKRGTMDGCDALSNLQSISTECHKRKTLEEEGKAMRPRIGADGYPLNE